MANINGIKGSIIKFLEAMKACDELPEGLEDEALKMSEGVAEAISEDSCDEDEVMEKEVEEKDEDEGVTEEKLEAKIEDTLVRVLRRHGVIRDAAMESLDEVEQEIEDECKAEVIDANGEEDVTVDPEKINDSAARKAFLREVKPIIASIPSSRTRAKLSDSIAKLLRKTSSGDSAYGAIYRTAMNVSRSKMSVGDSRNDSQENLGMDIAAKFNPHYKKED